jgi:hypothetical protein
MMISFAAEEEIKRLLGEGRLSQRKIARRVGVSRGTVNAIAGGKRPDRGPGRPADDSPLPSGRPARCPTCGGMVQMPCLACRVRALQAGGRRRGREVRPDRRGAGTRGRPGRAPAPSAPAPFAPATGDRAAATG